MDWTEDDTNNLFLHLRNENVRLTAENERLRADREQYNGWAKEIKLVIDEIKSDNERLRAGYQAIKKATIDGRVCDDVAWFDEITTLHDYCDEMLGDEQTGEKVK